ncbi:MAG: peptidyl-prolyl cis-trans isomerase [Thermodesulfovibrionales bacterium]|nr:peptidyl-prolyl cis-trans isomerase [Thermodesulfovibrionales bacterium]
MKLSKAALNVFCLSMALGMLFLGGCRKKPAAVVDGDAITKAMVDRALKERLAEHKIQGLTVAGEAMRQAVLEQIIAQRLMLQAAKELKITATDEETAMEIDFQKKSAGEEAFNKDLKEKGLLINDLRQQVKEKITIAKFMENLVPDGSVTEEEIREYYKASPMPFLMPESLLLRFIQTGTEAQAKAVLAEMKDTGISFDKMADTLGKGKRAIVSDYGWTGYEAFGPEIKSALKKLKAGSHGGPYKGAGGIYLLRIKERQTQRPETLEEAKDKIKAILLDNKRQAAVAHWVADRRGKAKVAIN